MVLPKGIEKRRERGFLVNCHLDIPTSRTSLQDGPCKSWPSRLPPAAGSQGDIMSAQENKLLAMEGYRLFQSGDIAKMLEMYHNDAEWIGPDSDYIPFAGSFHGKREIAQFFVKFDAALHANSFVPTQFIAEGDKVVVTGLASWTVKPTGRNYDSPWIHVLTIRDGKVARFETYYNTAAAERAFHPELAGQASAATRLHH